MQPNYPINYRAGFLESSNEYIPQIKEPTPQWYTKNRLPDYGSGVDDDYQPIHSTHEPTHFYQKMNLLLALKMMYMYLNIFWLI